MATRDVLLMTVRACLRMRKGERKENKKGKKGKPTSCTQGTTALSPTTTGKTAAAVDAPSPTGATAPNASSGRALTDCTGPWHTHAQTWGHTR